MGKYTYISSLMESLKGEIACLWNDPKICFVTDWNVSPYNYYEVHFLRFLHYMSGNIFETYSVV